MAIRETGYIRNMLKQTGPVQQPHYADAGYQAGEHIEGGFGVSDRPETPEHVVIHMGPQYIVHNDDMESRFREAEQNPSSKVIHLGNTVRYVMEDEETEADRKAKRAEAIAKAVELAIKNGDIDPEVFDQL